MVIARRPDLAVVQGAAHYVSHHLSARGAFGLEYPPTPAYNTMISPKSYGYLVEVRLLQAKRPECAHYRCYTSRSPSRVDRSNHLAKPHACAPLGVDSVCLLSVWRWPIFVSHYYSSLDCRAGMVWSTPCGPRLGVATNALSRTHLHALRSINRLLLLPRRHHADLGG